MVRHLSARAQRADPHPVEDHAVWREWAPLGTFEEIIARHHSREAVQAQDRHQHRYVTVGNFRSNDRMDYTIIGNAVNLIARLQFYAEIDGILLGHETYSLVKDEVAAEEQTPIEVKGFAEPVRCYKVQGLYDHLAEEGTVIREEQEGLKFHPNLQEPDKEDAIRILEGTVAPPSLIGPRAEVTATSDAIRAAKLPCFVAFRRQKLD